jgi:hypothetical protein
MLARHTPILPPPDLDGLISRGCREQHVLLLLISSSSGSEERRERTVPNDPRMRLPLPPNRTIPSLPLFLSLLYSLSFNRRCIPLKEPPAPVSADGQDEAIVLGEGDAGDGEGMTGERVGEGFKGFGGVEADDGVLGGGRFAGGCDEVGGG